jgi:hypothetical protein
VNRQERQVRQEREAKGVSWRIWRPWRLDLCSTLGHRVFPDPISFSQIVA